MAVLRSILAALTLLVVTGGLAACASSAPASDAPPTGRSARGMLPVTDHGLRIRQWRVADHSDRIGEAMTRHGDGEGANTTTIARLERNGFRFVRVPAEDVDMLLEDLGGAMVDIDGWHGQAYEWQEVLARPMSASGRGVAVDGRVRRLADGRVRLMLRGWTIPMEDGPAIHVELRPDHDRTRPTRFDQLLGRRSFRGERFASAGLDVLLEAGYAYVLTCEAPGVEWDEPADHDVEATVASTAPTAKGPGVGPEAAAPVTLGEVLLRHDASPPHGRDILVLIPRVPEGLMPVDTPRTARTGGPS